MNQWPVLQTAVEQGPDAPFPAFPGERLWRRLLGGRLAFPPGIYLFIYHSVFDDQNPKEWERHYVKGAVTAGQFRTQLAFLSRRMTPISLGDALSIWQRGGPDRPCFAVTFDDGYRNNLEVAAPVVRELGLRPCLFLNADFARGGVFFRVLAAVLVGQGHGRRLASALRESLPAIPWSDEPNALFNQTKQHYTPGIMEKTVESCYRACLGEPDRLGVSLTVADVQTLRAAGWEFGNHTDNHHILATLDATAVEESLARNAEFWAGQGVPLLPCVGYPLGRAGDVGPAVERWLDRHPEMHGLFANGGVNFRFRRKEWLRFGLGTATEPEALAETIWRQIYRTRRALARLDGGAERRS